MRLVSGFSNVLKLKSLFIISLKDEQETTSGLLCTSKTVNKVRNSLREHIFERTCWSRIAYNMRSTGANEEIIKRLDVVTRRAL